METKVERITPAMAQEYLKKNTENRAVRQGWVEEIATLMKDGKWTLTHQGVAFDIKGRLVDGQHRLMGIAQSGKTIEMLVARGLAEKTYRNIDAGRKRTFADRIKLCEDDQDNVIVIGITRCYLTVTGSTTSVTVENVENEFLEHSDAFMEVAMRFRQRVIGLTRNEVGAAIGIYLHHHKMRGRQFLQAFMTGEGLLESSPVLRLRESLFAGLASRCSVSERYWKTVGACRAHLEGKSLIALNASTEDFEGNGYARLKYAKSANAKKSHVTRKERQADNIEKSKELQKLGTQLLKGAKITEDAKRKAEALA